MVKWVVKNLAKWVRVLGGKGGGQGAGGGIFNVGKAGPFRIFQTALGQQVSWLLPLSLIGFVIAYFNEWRKKRKWFKFNKRQTHLLYWFGWLVPVYGFFSMLNSSIHTT